MQANPNRILAPYGSFRGFSAMVDGKPTGLAGCKLAAHCPRAGDCLRADERLQYPAYVTKQVGDACKVFILREA